MGDIYAGYGVKFLGPFTPEHRVIVEGRIIPHLSAFPSDDGSRITLVLDRRFMIEGDTEEVAKWVQFIANAMAVSGGWASLGAESKYAAFAPIAASIAVPPVLHAVRETEEM